LGFGQLLEMVTNQHQQAYRYQNQTKDAHEPKSLGIGHGAEWPKTVKGQLETTR
jgi:hypothetical protein